VGTFLPNLFLNDLVDDFGIWQHTDGTNILYNEGYALDDAARGLLFTLSNNDLDRSEVLFSYIIKSQSSDGFYGFANQNRQFSPIIASDDATGQVVWAAGYAVSKNFHNKKARQLIIDATSSLRSSKYVRGYAYALLGAIYSDEKLANQYYEELKSFFDKKDDDWPWPESALRYGNAIVPYAFLRYSFVYSNKIAAKTGCKILRFLEERCTHNRQRGPIGNTNGWLPQGTDKVPTYSQQPIDSAYMLWAWLASYQLSGDESERQKANDWMKWFEGDNVAKTQMYDPRNMQCFDGINPESVNFHSGAESNICFLLSKYMLDKNITI
jgi:hypothetical protein